MTDQIMFIRDRITELRLQKNISEYEMSLALGHSKGYIQGISSGRVLPSVTELLAICDYFGVTPREFFDEEVRYPARIAEVVDYLYELPENDLDFVVTTVRFLSEKQGK